MLENEKKLSKKLQEKQKALKKLTHKKKIELLEEISKIQSSLQEYRRNLVNTLGNQKIKASKKLQKIHKKLKINLFKYIFSAKVRHLISAPFIYIMIIPFVVLDVFLELYHNICFPLYRIKKVKRSDYIVIDRHKLAYLNLMQKINCVYCGYGNGLMAYAKEIAGRTERYWCPIKHSREMPDPHSLYKDFFAYLDGEGFTKEKKKIMNKNKK